MKNVELSWCRTFYPILALLFTSMTTDIYAMKPADTSGTTFYAPLAKTIHEVLQQTKTIPAERRQTLTKIAHYIQKSLTNTTPAQLMFICTHNSRRSHIAQIWAQTFAAYFGLQGVKTYSAGTEITAFNSRAVQALQRAGFHSTSTTSGTNPIYEVRYAHGVEPIRMYSQSINDPQNPRSNFCAVMTCSQADEACPIIAGATLRVSLPYDDPKEFDGTLIESQKYDERTLHIARELAYLFSQVRR